MDISRLLRKEKLGEYSFTGLTKYRYAVPQILKEILIVQYQYKGQDKYGSTSSLFL